MTNEPLDSQTPENQDQEHYSAPDIDLFDGAFPRIPLGDHSQPYLRDDLFKDLLKSYQNAEWEESLKILNRLIKLYPEEPSLLEFQDDIRMRSMLYQKGSQSQKVETRIRIGQIGIWIVAGVAAIAALFFILSWGVNEFSNRQEIQQEAIQATSAAQSLITKYENAVDYLEADRPQAALDLLEELEQIAPGYRDVSALILAAQDSIALNQRYEEGLSALDAGELNEAEAILREIYDQDPNYKNVAQLISQIVEEQTITRTVADIQTAYDQGDWQVVVDGYEQILALDSGFSMPELEEELFIAYMNLIIEIADQPDASMDDIRDAEDYYRDALALFPQSRDFADEREELERVATSLIVNKLYIYAVSLMETENYSVQSLEEAIRILTRANNIGSGSPAVAAEKSLAQSFLNAYNAFANRDYDNAILSFENLLRIEPDYGGGIMRFLLYESHIARGDIFATYGEFENAREDYQSAETYAWGENGSTLQLFQAEVRIGDILRRLGLYGEATEYFHYAAVLVNLDQHLDPSETDVLEALAEAQLAYQRNQAWDAARLYDYVYQEATFVFPSVEIRVFRGDSLAHIAYRYGSTLDLLREVNQLGESSEARMDQDILVPSLEEAE